MILTWPKRQRGWRFLAEAASLCCGNGAQSSSSCSAGREQVQGRLPPPPSPCPAPWQARVNQKNHRWSQGKWLLSSSRNGLARFVQLLCGKWWGIFWGCTRMQQQGIGTKKCFFFFFVWECGIKFWFEWSTLKHRLDPFWSRHCISRMQKKGRGKSYGVYSRVCTKRSVALTEPDKRTTSGQGGKL